MSRRRFYVPRDCIRGNIAFLPPDQIHHLRAVLRLRVGDEVELFDGEGAAYSGVVDLSGDQLCLTLLERLEPQAEPESCLILAQALLKFDKFEWILQKATELGVREIVPIETRYCDVRLQGNKVASRLERWNRIAREAAKQCRSVTVPKIHHPLDFAEFISRYETGVGAKLLFCEKTSRRWDGAMMVCDSALLCIGPEGGWHADEVEAAELAGFLTFNLGARILRAETAALTAVVLIQYQIAARGLRIAD